MKAICEGRSTRNEVVQQNLEQYRAVFTRTTQQINVLKAVSAANFAAEAVANTGRCMAGHQEVRRRTDSRLRHFPRRSAGTRGESRTVGGRQQWGIYSQLLRATSLAVTSWGGSTCVCGVMPFVASPPGDKAMPLHLNAACRCSQGEIGGPSNTWDPALSR